MRIEITDAELVSGEPKNKFLTGAHRAQQYVLEKLHENGMNSRTPFATWRDELRGVTVYEQSDWDLLPPTQEEGVIWLRHEDLDGLDYALVVVRRGKVVRRYRFAWLMLLWFWVRREAHARTVTRTKFGEILRGETCLLKEEWW